MLLGIYAYNEEENQISLCFSDGVEKHSKGRKLGSENSQITDAH